MTSIDHPDFGELVAVPLDRLPADHRALRRHRLTVAPPPGRGPDGPAVAFLPLEELETLDLDLQPAGLHWHVEQADALHFLRRQPADSIDMIFASPPYCDARTYGIDAARGCEVWVNWMLDLSEAAAAACRGPVFWVLAGVTRRRCYWPGNRE